MATSTADLELRVRFRHLRMLRTVAATGSLRAAAATLHLTQPALSKTLKELEQAFGYGLFTRSVRGLKPTARGEVVLRGAELLLAELDHLRVEADAAVDSEALTLRLGVPPFVALSTMPDVLHRLLAAARDIRVRLRENRVPQLFDGLLAGELDALLTNHAASLMTRSDASRLRYEKLGEEAFAVIAPAGHPLGRARRVTWSELAHAAWVLPDPNSLLRQTVEDCFVRDGVVPPAPIVESTSPVTNVRLAARGIGVTAVPARVTQEAEEAGAVVRVRVQPPLPAVAVALVYRASASAHPRITRLREALGLAKS